MMTMGHGHMTERVGPGSKGIHHYMVCIFNLVCRVGGGVLATSTDADGVAFHTAHAVGNDMVGLGYADSGSGFRRGRLHMGINNDAAQPGMCDTIAIIEQFKQQVIDGSRTLLAQAGLPPVLWA